MFLEKIALIFVIILPLIFSEDYYRLLRISKRSTLAQIRTSFKKLSLKYHPDKTTENPDLARKLFSKILHAYDILKDEEKRKIYDEKGEEGIRQLVASKAQPSVNDLKEDSGPNRNPEDLYYEKSLCIIFDLSTLSRFLKRNEVWIMFFYNLGDFAKRKSKMFKDLANKFLGFFKVAVINCDWEPELCEEQFDIEEHPLPLLLGYNSDYRNNTPVIYSGNLTANKVATFAVDLMESYVTLVNNDTYEQFYKQEFEIYKVLLFSDKKSTPPLYKVLSKEFKDRLIFGEIREEGNEYLQKEFNVTSYPTLIVVTKPEVHLGYVFKGDYNKEKLRKFLKEYAFKTREKKAKPNPGKIFELTAKIIKGGNCGTRDTVMCFVYIIPNLDSKEKSLEIIEKLALMHKDEPLNFYYVLKENFNSKILFNESNENDDGEENNEKTTEENDGGIYVLKTKKNTYTKYEGESIYDFDRINLLIDNVLGGNARFKKMKTNLVDAFNLLEKKTDL